MKNRQPAAAAVAVAAGAAARLLALDARLTDRRATAAAHRTFDRTLDTSLKAMREGVSLRDGRIEVELPYRRLRSSSPNRARASTTGCATSMARP